ncbi:hypothetical protein [Pseudobutyrivibrio sp. LB2011]|uniref:hypothetical protein n=1 Tax=Pseudobutyrivibrio sp. LB2011 TaxID=1408312 RepID=UPI0005D14431|nr:hypothetical protein [Pseudobutyrivibrio sp. LB2011]
MRKSILTSIISLISVMIMSLTSTLTANAQEVLAPFEPSGFDAQYYAQSNPDVYAIYGNDNDKLLNHYVTCGKFEGRKPYENAPEYTNTKTADYNVLFIGNSITLHPQCNYWWGAYGMAASSPEKDYVHKVIAGLYERYETVDYDIVSFSAWERKGVGKKLLPSLDPLLGNNYDLIVIQLGENAHDLKSFESEYDTLVNYVSRSVPAARIELVGDFWAEGNRDEMKLNVVNKYNTDYVDLSNVRSNKKYRSYIGAKVVGSDGQMHAVDFGPVSSHPNDLTMAEIAKGILKNLEN